MIQPNVEFLTSGGRTEQAAGHRRHFVTTADSADLAELVRRALTRFRLDWNWDGGPALLQSRAVDETGQIQPSMPQLRAVRGTRSIYHNNAIKTWSVRPNGEVWNVQLSA